MTSAAPLLFLALLQIVLCARFYRAAKEKDVANTFVFGTSMIITGVVLLSMSTIQ